ncbi:MAG: methylmalonyl-CoA epimerase [Candidatus Nanopelagicales bacterium]|nr:methylmalonyl-CoA epimerase [Candidatus Nanopelagicales bacterium]MDZ4249854.1 methylmalonyl-CoA epimerase [Candidatus Nanopelagicales bacterium]
MMPALAPIITRIDHVGIATSDLDAAIELYEQAFGARVVHREANDEQGVLEAMLAVGDSGSCIQLLAPLSPDSPIAKYLDRNGPGIQHVAFGVDDVEAAAAHITKAGLRVLYPQAKRGTAGSKVNFVHPKDCGGVLVELVEVTEP